MDYDLLGVLLIGAVIGGATCRLTVAVVRFLRHRWRQRRTAAAPEDRVISRTVVTFDDEQQMNEAIAAFDRGDISLLMRRANGR